jgi:acyl dehydratase
VPIPQERAPDWVVREQTLPEQALIYRLSGDYNPLHIGEEPLSSPLRFPSFPALAFPRISDAAPLRTDPRVGSEAGFGGVILHGLSTFGFAARAILHAVGGGQPTALRYFGARFTAPVAPGDALETSAWEVKRSHDGTTEVAFEVKNTTTGKVRPDACSDGRVFSIDIVLGCSWRWIRESGQGRAAQALKNATHTRPFISILYSIMCAVEMVPSALA